MARIVILFILLSLGGIKIAAGHERHEIINGKWMKAWHITLPGWTESYTPEDTIDLQKWVGTKYEPLKAVDRKTGKEIPEANAGLALKYLGIFPDYELKQLEGGNWALHRSAKTHRSFSMTAFYRVGPWRECKEH